MENNIKYLSDITYKAELTQPFWFKLAMLKNIQKGGVKFALITYSHFALVSYVLI